MGIELELAVLVAILVLGTSVFAGFEVETASWKKILKWSFLIGLTVGLFFWIGHWSLVPLILLTILGLTVHFWWCRKNGIHPLRAHPRRRYYELRGWTWPD